MKVQLIVFLLLVPLANAGYDSWQYVRGVSSGTGVHKLVLDEHVIQHMNQDGSDLRIDSNGELPYQIMSDARQTFAPSRITASSTRPAYSNLDFDAQNALDGDAGTYWESNVLEEKGSSFLVFLFPAQIIVDQAIISGPAGNSWTGIKIEALVQGTWQVLREQGNAPYTPSRSVSFPGVRTDGLKLSFTHAGSVQISEVSLSRASWTMVFEGAPGIKLYYGNPLASKPSYAAKFSITAATPFAGLGPARNNPDFNSDIDRDGVAEDNCVLVPNTDQRDADSDGVGDACDNCRTVPNGDQADADSDKFGNACDNCPLLSNPDQYDDDLNSMGYVCDDADSDGIINSRDNCVAGRNQYQEDRDKDGIGDACEDDDSDSFSNYADNCPSLPNPGQEDSDRNGVGDPCDDPDRDGVIAIEDNCPVSYNPKSWDGSRQVQPDKDNDGVGDTCDPKDDRYSEQPFAVWGLLIGLIAVIGIVAFVVFKRKQ